MNIKSLALMTKTGRELSRGRTTKIFAVKSLRIRNGSNGKVKGM